MKFFVSYFGCRSNQAEVQDWVINLENSGYKLVKNPEDADFNILNTCSVTHKAEKDVLKFINKNYKKTNTKWIIAGCTVTKSKEELQEKYKNYIFLTNDEKKNLVDIVSEEFPFDSNVIHHSSYKSRIFLKIQDGCNFRCTFCIVPSLRGKSRSIAINEIVKKAEYLVSLGFKEIILTGINLSSFGYDLFPRENLIGLVEELSKIKSLEFIRLSSLDPRFIKYEFIKKLSDMGDKIASSFHFSFQSGSNSVLKRMNRASKVNDYLKIMKTFKKFFPKANYGGDIIVGFPEESESEFNDTLEFIRDSGLDYLHVFPFSPREGTKAYFMKQVKSQLIKKRMDILKEYNREIKIKYKERFINKVLSAIVIEEREEYSLALTTNYISVRVNPSRGYKKGAVKLRIKRVINDKICEGELVK